jgi:hypothetical protein
LESSKEVITQLKIKNVGQQQRIEELQTALENERKKTQQHSLSISSPSLEEENIALKLKIESLEAKLITLQVHFLCSFHSQIHQTKNKVRSHFSLRFFCFYECSSLFLICVRVFLILILILSLFCGV